MAAAYNNATSHIIGPEAVCGNGTPSAPLTFTRSVAEAVLVKGGAGVPPAVLRALARMGQAGAAPTQRPECPGFGYRVDEVSGIETTALGSETSQVAMTIADASKLPAGLNGFVAGLWDLAMRSGPVWDVLSTVYGPNWNLAETFRAVLMPSESAPPVRLYTTAQPGLCNIRARNGSWGITVATPLMCGSVLYECVKWLVSGTTGLRLMKPKLARLKREIMNLSSITTDTVWDGALSDIVRFALTRLEMNPPTHVAIVGLSLLGVGTLSCPDVAVVRDAHKLMMAKLKDRDEETAILLTSRMRSARTGSVSSSVQELANQLDTELTKIWRGDRWPMFLTGAGDHVTISGVPAVEALCALLDANRSVLTPRASGRLRTFIDEIPDGSVIVFGEGIVQAPLQRYFTVLREIADHRPGVVPPRMLNFGEHWTATGVSYGVFNNPRYGNARVLFPGLQAFYALSMTPADVPWSRSSRETASEYNRIASGKRFPVTKVTLDQAAMPSSAAYGNAAGAWLLHHQRVINNLSSSNPYSVFATYGQCIHTGSIWAPSDLESDVDELSGKRFGRIWYKAPPRGSYDVQRGGGIKGLEIASALLRRGAVKHRDEGFVRQEASNCLSVAALQELIGPLSEAETRIAELGIQERLVDLRLKSRELINLILLEATDEWYLLAELAAKHKGILASQIEAAVTVAAQDTRFVIGRIGINGNIETGPGEQQILYMYDKRGSPPDTHEVVSRYLRMNSPDDDSDQLDFDDFEETEFMEGDFDDI